MGINEITWRKMIGRVENRACDKEVKTKVMEVEMRLIRNRY